MMKKIFFLIFIFLFHFPARGEMNSQEWGQHLTSIHDVNWNFVAQKYGNNKEAISKVLQAIVANNTQLISHLDSFQKRYAWENALRGLGHFINKKDLSFYKSLESQLSKTDDEYGKVALYESLKNTGSKDALNLLAQYALEERTLWLSIKALESGDKLVSGEVSMGAEGDLAYIPFFFPNLRESFLKRSPFAGKNDQIDWESALEEILTAKEKIESDYRNQSSQDIHPDMIHYFRTLEEKFMNALNQAKVAHLGLPESNNKDNHDSQAILLAQAGERDTKNDFGTLGQAIGKFSDQEMVEKTQLAEKLEEQNAGKQDTTRGIASETETPSESATDQSPPYFLYGIIVLLFAVMVLVGIKFSKKKK